MRFLRWDRDDESAAARNRLGALGVLVLFVVFGTVGVWDVSGDDLASSYLGCRVLAAGQVGHLYAYDPDDFAGVGDDKAWDDAADAGGFESYQHPYVQTPLWAYSLRPLCTRLPYAWFVRLFILAAMFSLAGCIWLTGWVWAPELLTPGAMAAITLILWTSQPFRYAISLVQTHVLYVLMTLAALVLAERRRGGWAGLLLAGAAAVKITPGVLVVYWALTRRWRAAISMVAWSAVLWIAGYVLTGRAAMTAYIANMHRISRVLLVAFNNESLAAWWMGRFYPGEVEHFHMFPLPGVVRVVSTLAMLLLTALGGMLDRRAHDGRLEKVVPLGAMMGVVAATVFAPINWVHYAIVLIAPLMLLVHASRNESRTARWILRGGVAVVIALNLRPLARNLMVPWTDTSSCVMCMVRSEFYGQMLCLALLGAAAWMRARHTEDRRMSLVD